MEYKGFTIDDEKLDKVIDACGCSIIEACDMILEEDGKVAPSAETEKAVAEIEKEAKGMKRHYEKSDKPRKPSVKVRKVDETKGLLLKGVQALVEEMGAVEIALETETELHFTYEGAKYTFKLTKHRPPKK